MGTARITSGPTLTKADAYKSKDLKTKLKKRNLMIAVLSSICFISVICNIILMFK